MLMVIIFLFEDIFHIKCGDALHQTEAVFWELSSFKCPKLLEEAFLFVFDHLVDDFILVGFLFLHDHVEVDISFLNSSN